MLSKMTILSHSEGLRNGAIRRLEYVSYVCLSILSLFAERVVGELSVEEHSQCGVYLAESSIPNAGWGVFAGRDYQLGENIVGIKNKESTSSFRLRNMPH